MPSLGTLAFCFQFLMVAASSQPSLDLILDSAVHASLTSENGIEEDDFQTMLQRQKREAFPIRYSHSAYIVNIGLSFTSPLVPSQDYFKNLSLPILINTSDSMITISNINVTTDAPPMNKFITIKMSVKLDINFQDALRNPSSDLYMKYKHDFEKAFTNAYQRLPGFISATVTGFRPGSVSVDYDVKTASATLAQLENANRDVLNSVNASYMINITSFVVSAVITDQTNFTVFPDDIFEGDTVTMTCQTNITSWNVTWDHSGQVISQSDRHSIQSTGTSISTLKITNCAQSDSGPYTCVFKDPAAPSVLYKATRNLTVTSINIVSSDNIDVICKRVDVLLTCCTNRNLQPSNVKWSISGQISISGTASIKGNCSEYLLEIYDFQCSPSKSGAVASYKCELSFPNGVRRSKVIEVTYLQIANITITSPTNVSEGYSFSLTCISNVMNYNKVIWEIQTGTTNTTIESHLYIQTYPNQKEAMSNLTIKTATLDWNGTYTCTFFQKNLPSSARTAVEVVPLPLKQNIFLDPIEAFIRCKIQQELKCCTNKMENYNVTFTVESTTFFPVKRPQNNQICYVYNYIEKTCNTKKDLLAYCTFQNRIHGTIRSPEMKLHVIPDTANVLCSDSTGIGKRGDRITKPCLVLNNPMRGNITYMCLDKVWIVDRNNCISAPINTLLTAAEALLSSPQPKEKLPEYLKSLVEVVRKEEQKINTSPPDLGAVVTILDLVSTIPEEAAQPTVESFLNVVDIIVSNTTINSWNELNQQKTTKSSLLLESVERFTQYLQPVNNTIPSIRNTNLQLEGIVISEGNRSQYAKNFTFPGPSGLSGNVLINEVQVQDLQANTTIISVAYSTLGQILPHRNENNESVNGLVMTTTVSGNISWYLKIIMTFGKSNISLIDPQCVFWNFTSGQWDNTGCTPENHEQDVTCICNHLTSFSILMSPHAVSIGGNALDYITYIGLSISILSLLACILIEFLVWKSVTKNRTSYMRHICMLNIATSLLIADIWFIVAASLHDMKETAKDICIAVTFFIHLFYLCVFFWMLALGLMLFYRLVFILHDTSKTTQKAVAFSLGYGCPITISVITIAVTHPYDAYKRKDACWLIWETSKALLAFVIPALIIVAVNFIIAIVVIGKILRPAVGDKPSQQERSSFIQVGKSIGVLTPLLGLTWGFGFATVIKDTSVVFHILFTILNALQGLFILLFGTVWDKKVREALLNKCSSAKMSSQQTKSTSQGISAPAFSMKSPLSKPLNNLCGKTGKYDVSSTETMSFSTENTSMTNSFFH
ncbi:adhesion G protein-coupled receptor F5 isoform X2 [Alligator mississippiensis]|nr:adhesion G protein-coupled receptor F5 isoform X2 [Alligator mississippiensis]XP_019335441.1 adhesion G protein-coupled receptor F5 isoform X2 [Alligator mississippiensis]XP_019335680.1 adhesion G protein-coupled receptor F5 isoform X2 [Alligator mississippiensis]XP_019335718.1 adhesion G protein-coupled receptor F5 isoform X2 [Alligator mississippiensis]